MRVAGIKDVSFTGKDGNFVSGKTLYLAEKIPSHHGSGEEFEKIFLSDNKLKQLGFNPAVDQTVTVFYNKYGKVETLNLIDELIEIE